MAGDVENSIIQSVRHVPKRRHVRLQLEQDCPAAPVVQAEGPLSILPLLFSVYITMRIGGPTTESG
jgi:hypothetical protein